MTPARPTGAPRTCHTAAALALLRRRFAASGSPTLNCGRHILLDDTRSELIHLFTDQPIREQVTSR